MLWVALLSCLAVSVTASIGGSILFPGATECTAPSGRPGDCVVSADCPPSHGPPSRRPCGLERWRLRFCCEKRPTRLRPLRLTFPVQNLLEKEPRLPTDCGLGGPRDSDGLAVLNVAGGKDADRSSWPWAVLLGRDLGDSDDIQWLCGGVLLGPRHVLTAAHCVTSTDRGRLVLRLGEHDLREESSSTRQERRVSRVVRHPAFNGSLADLALLVLDRPVRLRRGSVHPICLPPADARLVSRAGYVVGWGQLGFEDDTADVLQEAPVTVVETRSCERQYQRTRDYRSRFPGGWRGSVLCAKDLQEGGRDACQGDSGGPLSVRRGDGRYQLAGLVLEGIGCGNPDFPGLYTDVSHYVKWIRREVERS